MYKWFEIKNFKCFKDLRIDNLARVNLIVGKNNDWRCSGIWNGDALMYKERQFKTSEPIREETKQIR